MQDCVRPQLRLEFASPPCFNEMMRATKYAITVGVNAPIGSHPLRFALRDARALAYHFRSGRGGSFQPDEVECLLDWNARIKDVEDAIRRVPDFVDMLVFTFSGHGNRYGIELQDGHLPFEILAVWLRDTHARRKLIIIDSCGAGGLIEHGPELGGPFEFDRDEPYDAAIFNSLDGARVLTSCSRTQNAHEDPRIKHGVFTWLLLQSRKYLHGNANDIISAEEAFNFAKVCLCKLRHTQQPKEYGPLRQFPFSRSGRFLPIGSVGIQAALTPSYPYRTNDALIGIEATIVGRRHLPTYIDVTHETGGQRINAGTQPLQLDYHETAVNFSLTVPLHTIPRLAWPGQPQPITTQIRVRDEADRVIATQHVSWQLTSYAN